MPLVTSKSTRFTAAEFERMCDAGVFGSRRAELISGRIYRVAAQKLPHAYTISRANRVFVANVPPTETLFVQSTFRLDPMTTVDPDFLWIAKPIGTPGDLLGSPVLILEVADTTYRKDSGPKLRTYAWNGVRDYWISNVKADRVEVYRDPQNPTGNVDDCRYASVTHHHRGETIASLVRPQATFRVDDLLP